MLELVDLSARLGQKAYKKRVAPLQTRARMLAYKAYRQERPVVIVFEGWDAAGKGGAIKRLTERMDPRSYIAYPIKAPEGEDKERQYLYRFWRRLPEQGQIAIFDRSWYGRVMVERVEGFCTPAEWARAYDEINQFERQLLDFGTLVFKFWLHISQEEQLRRFTDRAGTAHKTWKLTEEDWRNRTRWDDYAVAVDEMLEKTSTPGAPWTVVAADSKLHARVTVLETVVDGLAQAMDD